MENEATRSRAARSELTRRSFLGAAGAGAAGFTIVPRHVLGGAPFVAPNDKVNIAFIGTGSQGLRVMLGFLRNDDVQGVAVCDPNKSSDRYPQWGKSEFRDGVRRLLGTNSGWEWLSLDDSMPLHPLSPGWNGVAGREPCQKIVDGYYGTQKRSGNYRGCAAYSDFRELLEKEKDVDAVVVGATDCLHAAVSIAAMKKGKHVFCQKPMCRTIHEARRMAEVAQQTGVATQVAVLNQGSETQRRIEEWVSKGMIGPVREVLNWSSRPFWPQGIDRPKETQPIPAGLDWNLWLGPAPERPFHSIYLPFVWRGWYDFGCGALGDMGCYSFDTIFRVLKLAAPTSVEATTAERHGETFPTSSTIRFEFAARGDQPPVKLTWYDGGLKPPRPEALGSDKELEDEGLIFVGEKGLILSGFSGASPRLIPEPKGAAPETPRQGRQQGGGGRRSAGGAQRLWLDACKGGKTKPLGHFEFSAVVTEALQVGNIAVRTGERITWDAATGKVTNLAGAEQYVRPERRAGWEL
jgi:predicted dehydrogenase